MNRTLLTRLRDELFDRAGAAFDRAVVRAALDLARHAPDRERVARDDHWGHLAELARVAEAYGDPAHISNPARFFRAPHAIQPAQTPVRALPRERGAVLDLHWPSGFEPFHPLPRDEHCTHVENLTAHARLWLHPDPRPTVLCVHGYLGGHWGLEERAFAVRWLQGLGVDVALALLPFHGVRCPQGRQGMWPGRDPWRTVEGFAQAVYDLRALIRWLRGHGAPTITLFGMSLGAYTSALVATVCDDVDHAVLMIPLASLADVYIEHRETRDDRPPSWLRPRIDQAFRVVSPLARPSRLQGTDVLVLAAGGDGITRRSHAERLAAHFGAPMEVFPGGHLLQAGRSVALASVARLLARHGLLAGGGAAHT